LKINDKEFQALYSTINGEVMLVAHKNGKNKVINEALAMTPQIPRGSTFKII